MEHTKRMPRHWKGDFLQKMRDPASPAAVSSHSSRRRLVGQLITLDLQPYPPASYLLVLTPASYLLVLIPDSANTREALDQTVKQAGGQLRFSVLPQHRPPRPLPGHPGSSYRPVPWLPTPSSTPSSTPDSAPHAGCFSPTIPEVSVRVEI